MFSTVIVDKCSRNMQLLLFYWISSVILVFVPIKEKKY